jgi:predicted GH43/DUF377 family glycosyl hydrolase
MIVLVLLACLLLAGCGRYDDFQLPSIERAPAAGSFLWEAQRTPVLTRGPAGEWDSVDALNPSIVRTSQGYFNFYSGFDGKTWHTGLATSADGITWTKAGKGLSPEGWEGDYIAANGSAVPVDGQFLYWYQAGKLPRIGLARSSDGRAWTKLPQPVLDVGPRGSWDERGVADPYVLRLGGAYYM